MGSFDGGWPIFLLVECSTAPLLYCGSGRNAQGGIRTPNGLLAGRVTACCVTVTLPARMGESAWKESNLRSRAPEARAMPGYATR